MKIVMLVIATVATFSAYSSEGAGQPSADLLEARQVCAKALKESGRDYLEIPYKGTVAKCFYRPMDTVSKPSARKKPEPLKVESPRPATFRPIQSPQSGRVHVCYKAGRRIVSSDPCDQVK